MHCAAIMTLALLSLATSSDNTLTPDDLKPHPNESNGMLYCDKEIALSKDFSTNASLEITSKGNGTLKILNLSLRVYDSHHDSNFYKNKMLDIEFIDIDDDDHLDLVISGIYYVTSEKDDGILEEHAVFLLYLFDPETNRFKLAYDRKPEELDQRFIVRED